MSRRANEQFVAKGFANFLNRTTGRIWTPSVDAIPNPNGRTYDCEFTSEGSRPIASDFFQLFASGSEQALQGARNRLISKLTAELHDQGVRGLYFETPFPEKKHVSPQWFSKTARAFRDAVMRDPNAEVYEVDGLYARRCGDHDGSVMFGHHWVSMHQPIEAAGYPLARILQKKKDQIAVEGHARYLIGTMAGMPVSVRDVIAACAFIDFSEYPSIDRIYFQTLDNEFTLVYDWEARQALEHGVLPENDELRRLVVVWVEVLMACKGPQGLDLALQISWDQGGTEWLSSGRELLKFEAHLLLQNSEWKTPRDYWEIHCGSVPLTLDGRRRVQPIRAA